MTLYCKIKTYIKEGLVKEKKKRKKAKDVPKMPMAYAMEDAKPENFTSLFFFFSFLFISESDHKTLTT